MSRNLKDRQFFTRNIEEENWEVFHLHIHSDLALKGAENYEHKIIENFTK